MISVIIPFFNSEKYIYDCVQSVLDQSFKDIEVICIDDGSRDKSAEIVEGLINTDSRIRLIARENRGRSAARNRGLDEAKGELLFCRF